MPAIAFGRRRLLSVTNFERTCLRQFRQPSLGEYRASGVHVMRGLSYWFSETFAEPSRDFPSFRLTWRCQGDRDRSALNAPGFMLTRASCAFRFVYRMFHFILCS